MLAQAYLRLLARVWPQVHYIFQFFLFQFPFPFLFPFLRFCIFQLPFHTQVIVAQSDYTYVTWRASLTYICNLHGAGHKRCTAATVHDTMGLTTSLLKQIFQEYLCTSNSVKGEQWVYVCFQGSCVHKSHALAPGFAIRSGKDLMPEDSTAKHALTVLACNARIFSKQFLMPFSDLRLKMVT